jgi:hypothetical protein
LRPAVDQAGAERAVVATPGYCEKVGRWSFGGRFTSRLQDGLLAQVSTLAFLDHRSGVAIGKEAHVGNAKRLGAHGIGIGHRRSAVGMRTAGKADRQADQGDQYASDQGPSPGRQLRVVNSIVQVW